MSDVYDNTKDEELIDEPKEEKVLLNGEEIGRGFGYFFIGVVIGLFVYYISLVALLGWFSFHYAVKAIIALIFTLLLLKAFDKAMGQKETRSATAILVVVFIAFFMTIFIGYEKNNDGGECIKKEIVANPSSEIFSFTNKEQLVSENSFPGGKEIRIRVQGSPINMVTSAGKQTLNQEYGTYVFRFNANGSLIFEGTGSPSTVTVRW